MSLANTPQKLEAIVDEARLQAHLGMKELNDRWQARQDAILQQMTKLKELEQKARAKIDAARLQAHLAKAEASDRVASFREALRELDRDIGAAYGEFRRKLDDTAV